ncbi:MAG: hypothetical protein KBF93_12935 [Leptospiraceae bacterium]|nr:hypothetical protein [Leptospiraceae bacterium]
MSKKSILVIFCEGKHDSAFLSLVLKSMGYKYFGKPMNHLPLCFSYILKKIESLNTQELTLGQIADDRFIFPFPWIFENERTIVALYRLDGISRIINIGGNLVLASSVEKLRNKGIRNDFFSEEITSIEYRTIDELIEKIIEKTTISKLEEAIIRANVTKQEIIDTIQVIFDAEKYLNPKEIDFTTPVHFSFFMDADNDGISNRLQSIKNVYNQYFKGIDPDLKVYEPLNLQGRNVGLFIFTKGEGDETGDLEDVVISIIQKGDFKNLYLHADSFVSTNESFSNGTTFKYYPKKAKIGVAGQLRCSGEDIETILMKSDFLNTTHESFKKNFNVLRIKKFINDMFT